MSDDLWNACAKVGKFLYTFALVEEAINDGIIKILDLKGDAAEVVTNSVDFFRKANLLRTIALETAPAAEKDDVNTVFKAIYAQNENRILMAHSAFEPTRSGDVQFRRTAAKDGKIRKHDPLWTDKDFQNAYKSMQDIQEKLISIKPRLTLVISEEGKRQLFSSYLYSPTTPWVPTGDAD